MAKQIKRIDGPRRSRPARKLDAEDGLFMGNSPLVDGTLPDEYIVGRHRSEYVDLQSHQRDKAYLLEQDLQDLKSNIIDACESLAYELANNKISRIFKVDF